MALSALLAVNIRPRKLQEIYRWHKTKVELREMPDGILLNVHHRTIRRILAPYLSRVAICKNAKTNLLHKHLNLSTSSTP